MDWVKEHVTWEQFGADLKKLSRMIKQHKYNKIYGIPRGGWCPAVVISHRLEVECIPIFDKIYDNILIVDDLADTGKTLMEFKDYDIATIYYKPRSLIKPKYYVHETNNWIVFPWEKDDEIPNREV